MPAARPEAACSGPCAARVVEATRPEPHGPAAAALPGEDAAMEIARKRGREKEHQQEVLDEEVVMRAREFAEEEELPDEQEEANRVAWERREPLPFGVMRG